jgi:hypothetical protein
MAGAAGLADFMGVAGFTAADSVDSTAANLAEPMGADLADSTVAGSTAVDFTMVGSTTVDFTITGFSSVDPSPIRGGATIRIMGILTTAMASLTLRRLGIIVPILPAIIPM